MSRPAKDEEREERIHTRWLWMRMAPKNERSDGTPLSLTP